MLTPAQETYLAKRISLQKIWPWAAGFLTLICVLTAVKRAEAFHRRPDS